MVIPGFSALTVKARGGPGEVMAFWKEKGEERDIDLSIADLSAGSVRFLCWAALLVQSNPPPLICIDEPEIRLSSTMHGNKKPGLEGLLYLV